VAAICVVCSRCKHKVDPERDCGEANTIDEMMEWMYFKTGTYWIYQEQNTGALDTMSVYFDYNGNSPGGFRDFVIKMRSSLDGYTYEYWFNDSYSGYCSLRLGCYCRAVDCDKYKPGDYAGGGHVFAFGLEIGSQVGQIYDLTGGASRIIDMYESDTIQGFTFGRTYEFHQDFSPQHDYLASNYRIVRNIGITKKTISELNENWELIEYQILQ
jgi:hypothetical protein